MRLSNDSSTTIPGWKQGLVVLTALQLMMGTPAPLAAQSPVVAAAPITPIQHVIIIIGENRSFDHVYATYQSPSGTTVSNLLSKGIVKADGTPGTNYAAAYQANAVDNNGTFSISPTSKSTYTLLPPVAAGGATSASDLDPAPFATLSVAEQGEPFVYPTYYRNLTTGATGLPSGSLDTRLPNPSSLPPGPYQLTPHIAYDDYSASPVHRFYQMWQETDCSIANATPTNPSGCISDLFPWVETTIGAGSNGAAPPTNQTQLSTGEGSAAMGFYNVQQGDAPYMKYLADNYTLGDNFHQSVMGGTGFNHIMFGFADAIWYTNTDGTPGTPPANEIENPNPQANSNNYYDQDGYSGGSYSACADTTQPGVAPVVNYLQSLPTPIDPRCQAGHYYLLNNYNPGYNGNGTLNTSTFTLPPVNSPSIGDVMMTAGLSFKYYGEHWNRYVADPNGTNTMDRYCNICNPFQYEISIMGNATNRAAHIQDEANFFSDVTNNTLPAVSIIKPSGFTDGHPASSKLDLFEGFTEKIVNAVQANPTVWASTAIFITFDEGGGYYDSGYIQPVDFFGDGTRMPLLVVSPYSTGGKVYHGYSDHVSLIKFIERNWSLPTISSRSRDNFPNPQTANGNPYVPTNSPALDDMFSSFTFPATPTTPSN